MQYTNLNWRDGQPYSEIFDDIYYSSNEGESISGQCEFNHVFFKNNGLPERWNNSENFVIAELGFGSGLNCLLTIREWLKHIAETNSKQCLHYIAIEKYPLSPQAIVELVSRYPELKMYCDELVDNYPPAIESTHSRHLFDNRVVIHYKFMDAYDAIHGENLNVDAWYLDGFSPANNSAMWSESLFAELAKNSHVGTTCSTYTAAGFVKRNLINAGFDVNKVAGYGKKREMLVATLTNKHEKTFRYADKPWFDPPKKFDVSNKKATVIGAGIAGLCVAYALVRRGWRVEIIDKHGVVAKETSANPAAIVYPRLSVNHDVDSLFYTAAYFYNLQELKLLQKKAQQQFWFDDGLLQLMDKKRILEIIEKFQFNDDYVSVTDNVLNTNDKVNNEKVYIEYKSAGVVLPKILCEVLKKECGDRLDIIYADVNHIKRIANQWLCFADAMLINEAEILVVANGVAVNDLGLGFNLPVERVRGQVAEFKANKKSESITKAVNSGFYITPAIHNKHYVGATYSRESSCLDIDPDDNKNLFNSLNHVYPDVFKQDAYCGAWVGFRAMSKDRVPVVGAVQDDEFFNLQYADICQGNVNRSYQPAQYSAGLYISAAHGSRGFTSSFLSAEIIASQIEGEPIPVSKKVLDYLNPSRFTVNNLKRR